jgi:hypothetical protein
MEENEFKGFMFLQRWLWRVLSSGMYRRVVRWKSSDVDRSTCHTQQDAYHEGYSSTLNIEMTCPSETSADIQQTTQRYIPEDRTLQFKIVITLLTMAIITSVRQVRLTESISWKSSGKIRHPPNFFWWPLTTRLCLLRNNAPCGPVKI